MRARKRRERSVRYLAPGGALRLDQLLHGAEVAACCLRVHRGRRRVGVGRDACKGTVIAQGVSVIASSDRSFGRWKRAGRARCCSCCCCFSIEAVVSSGCGRQLERCAYPSRHGRRLPCVSVSGRSARRFHRRSPSSAEDLQTTEALANIYCPARRSSNRRRCLIAFARQVACPPNCLAPLSRWARSARPAGPSRPAAARRQSARGAGAPAAARLTEPSTSTATRSARPAAPSTATTAR